MFFKCTCPFRGFPHHGHPVYNPPEYPYLYKYNGKGYPDFHPVRIVSLLQRYIPVVCNEYDIEPVQHNPDQSEDSSYTDESEVPCLCPVDV